MLWKELPIHITKKSNLDQLQVSQAQGVSLHGN